MRCDCPGCWDCGEQNGKRPPGRGENASDCSGKSGVKDHWNGQGNLAALGLIPGLHPRGSGLGRTRTTKLSPSSALGERGCPCPAPAASQSTLGKHSSGVTQVFRWDISPSPQGMQDASPGLCIHTAQDLLKVMDAKVSPQFSNEGACLPHFQTSAAVPTHLQDPSVLQGRDGDDNNGTAISSTLGCFKPSHLSTEPSVFHEDLLCPLSPADDGAVLTHHQTGWDPGTALLQGHRTTERFGLKGTVKITQLQPSGTAWMPPWKGGTRSQTDPALSH